MGRMSRSLNVWFLVYDNIVCTVFGYCLADGRSEHSIKSRSRWIQHSKPNFFTTVTVLQSFLSIITPVDST